MPSGRRANSRSRLALRIDSGRALRSSPPAPSLRRRKAAARRLNRSFEASATNRKWMADFTYMWTAEGWLYVAAVVDLFSSRVVGWSMNAAMTAQLVTDALVMVIWRRGKPDAPLHHSDRGSQYTNEQFPGLMADHGVVCSMSRSGKVWDNAARESFFSLLKTERTTRRMQRTRDDAKPTSSIILSASTIRNAGTRRSDI
jgi:putative transposase